MPKDIEHTIVFSELLAATQRPEIKYCILEGSTRSSKTYSVLQYLVYIGLSKKVEITIGMFRLTWLKSNLLPRLYEVLESFGMFNVNWLNKTENTYTLPNGTVISFLGIEESLKLKGSYQDYCYIDEILDVPQRSYEMLDARTTAMFIGSYNPAASKHWVYDALSDSGNPDVWFHRSNYKMNPFLTQRNIDAIEKWDPNNPANVKNGTDDEYLWAVYGKGERMAPTGLIFRYNIIRDNEIPDDAYNVAYGLDLGFANDQAALIYKVEKDENIYFHEELYEVGLTTLINPGNPNQASLESEFIKRDIDKRTPMFIDNSRPETIKDLQNAGYMAQACKKFPGSIGHTINVIKEYKMCVTESSINLIHELNAYRYDEKMEEASEKGHPSKTVKVKGIDHAIDGCRYASESCRKKPDKGTQIDSIKSNPGIDKYDYYPDQDEDDEGEFI